MEVLFAPFFFVILLLVGPFVALNAYVLVWLCGPAIRRAGRKWEEGRNQALAGSWELEQARKPWAPFGYAPAWKKPVCAFCNSRHSPSERCNTPSGDPPVEKESLPGNPDAPAYNLDAGHRFLGGTGKKSA
jgi:hypothetical protein